MSTISNAIQVFDRLSGIGKVFDFSDELTNTTTQLNRINDGLQTSDQLNQMVFDSANRSRMSYQNMAGLVALVGTNVGSSFGSTQQMVAFTEQLNKRFMIAGATTEDMNTAFTQLTQGLGTGVVSGQQLNAVFKAAPNIVQSIADYLGVDIGQIRQMAEEGLLTADIVKNAMFATADETNEQFAQIPLTFSDLSTYIETQGIKMFLPLFGQLRQLANNEAVQRFVNGFLTGLSLVAAFVKNLVGIMGKVGSFVADNWSVIAPIVFAIVGAFTAYRGILMAVAAAKTFANVQQAIANVLFAGTSLRVTLANACLDQQAASSSKAAASQWALNSSLLACPLTWIIIAIVAVIAIIYAVIAVINKLTGKSYSATGVIAGAFGFLGACVYDVFAGIANFSILVVQIVVNLFQKGIYAIKALFAFLLINAIAKIPVIGDFLKGVSIEEKSLSPLRWITVS